MTEQFKCMEGYSFCCTPVPIKESVINKNKDKQVTPAILAVRVSEDEILVYTRSMKCIYLRDDNKCNIYEDRPQLCRDFGLKKQLKCPYLSTKGVKRSEAKTKQLERQFKKRVIMMKKEAGI